MKGPRHRACAGLTLALLAGFGLAACDLEIDPPDETRESVVVDDIAVLVPTDWETTLPEALSDGDGCDTRGGGGLDAPGEGHVAIWLVGPDCAGGDPANGSLGTFSAPEDIPAPIDLQQTELEVGTLTTFQHTYTECSNSCTDFVYEYAMVELAHPADPAHPTLLMATDTEHGIDLAALAAGLRYRLPNAPNELVEASGIPETEWYRPTSAADTRDGGLAVRLIPSTIAVCDELWTATDGTRTWALLGSTPSPVTGEGEPEAAVADALESCFRNETMIAPMGVASLVAAFAADPEQPLEVVTSEEDGPSLTQTDARSVRYQFQARNTVTGEVLDYVVLMQGSALVSMAAG